MRALATVRPTSRRRRRTSARSESNSAREIVTISDASALTCRSPPLDAAPPSLGCVWSGPRTKYTRLPDAEFPLFSDAFWGAANARPEFRTTAGRLFDKGLQQRSELEYHLGEDIAAIAQG
jgi:hypothetical protein